MGFKINVNGEQVWESEGDASLVNTVSVNGARGELVSIGASNDEYLNVDVNIRSFELTTDLDLVENKKAQERRDSIEAAGKVPEPVKKSTKKNTEKEAELVEL